MKKRNLIALISFLILQVVAVSARSTYNDNMGANKLKGNSMVANTRQSSVDYATDMHSRILKMFPGTYLDSMGIVINLLSDSIRNKLSKTEIKDSVAYLKTCLNSALKDSILLDKLSKLLSEGKQVNLNSGGVLTIHCEDASNSSVIDSVAMDLFSGSRLIASAMADRLGAIQMQNIPAGDYYVVFSRRGYVPLSLKHIALGAAGQSYLNILLSKENSYLVQLLNKNIWLCFTAGVILFLIIITVLAYYLAKFRVKRQNKAVK